MTMAEQPDAEPSPDSSSPAGDRRRPLFDLRASGPEEPPKKQGSEAPVLDCRQIMDAVGGEQAMIPEYFETFTEEFEEHLTFLERAGKVREAEPARRAAHAIKGQAGLMGFVELHYLAHRMEVAAKDGRFEELTAGGNALREAFQRLAKELKAFVAHGAR